MKIAALFVAGWFIGASAAAQTPSATTKQERVVLDSPQKRVVRDNYHDDQAVVLSGSEAGGWRLDAGAAIDARRIDLTMYNVRGEVRFRADWSRLQSLLHRTRR